VCRRTPTLPVSCRTAPRPAQGRDNGTVLALSYVRQVEVTVGVNGRPVRGVVSAGSTLLDWLSEELGLTGANKGCNESACGTCTSSSTASG
jgi:hypothetical protein